MGRCRLEGRVKSALLDTSVIVGLGGLALGRDLPFGELHVSTLTLAELAQGPVFARTDAIRRVRTRMLADAHRAFPRPLPFDEACVSAFGSIAAVTAEAGRRSRGRTLDLMIAATALASGLPLLTRNPKDVEHLAALIDVQTV